MRACVGTRNSEGPTNRTNNVMIGLVGGPAAVAPKQPETGKVLRSI
jgi:hypothetical protein